MKKILLIIFGVIVSSNIIAGTPKSIHCPKYEAIKPHMITGAAYLLEAYNADNKYFSSKIYKGNPHYPIYLDQEQSTYDEGQKELHCAYYAYSTHDKTISFLINQGDY